MRLHCADHSGPCYELEDNFWITYRAAMGTLFDQHYFTEDFPSECPDGHPEYIDISELAKAMSAELGVEFDWHTDRPASTAATLDIVEFMFCHVSKPTEGWEHSWCNGWHPTAFSRGRGRYEYTVQVNNLFERFGYSYQLRKGRVERCPSGVLDRQVRHAAILTSDDHLADMIEKALEGYYDRSRDRKREALTLLANALERTKTRLKPGDKKTAVCLLVERMAPAVEVRQHYDALLRVLTDIGNSHGIRHREVGQVEELPEELVEALFHIYFATIQYVLRCVEARTP